ncbi:MAG: class I SAM-dependent methyltransferase [Pseudomonadales bacterium]
MKSSQLFDEWTTYERVVANDYMHHREYFDALVAHLTDRFDTPIVMADLGCGDARPILPVLEAFAIQHYTGIDQSTGALDRARNLLESAGVPFLLYAGSMQEGIKNLGEPCDLIIASYSVHHLGELEKADLLHECRRMLVPGGTFAIIDVFMLADETRASYLRRWEDHARRNFTGLSANELDELLDHVKENDFPETISTYQRLAGAAGFEDVKTVKQGPEQLNRLIFIS